MGVKGEKLRNLILERLYDYKEHGIVSVAQSDLLEDLRQSDGIHKDAFHNAILTLANQNYIFDKASTCGLQDGGIIEAEKLLGFTTDHQKISDQREQQSINNSKHQVVLGIAAVLVTIFFGLATLIKLEIPISQVWSRSTNVITKAFYTCQETPCTEENEIRVFTAPITEVNMTWHYQNIQPGATLAREWKLKDENEKTWARYDCKWAADMPTTGSVDFVMKEKMVANGLPTGTWVLTIWVDGNRVLEESIKITGSGGKFDRAPDSNYCFDPRDTKYNQ